MKHRPGSIVFGIIVGLAVAIWSYQWITDPTNRETREEQEHVVLQSRELMIDKLGLTDPEVVDPLSPQRSVGKVYVYPIERGWEVSGFYRRNDGDSWHPYLVSLDLDVRITHLKVQDDAVDLAARAASDQALEILP